MWIIKQKTGKFSAVERYKDRKTGKYKTVSTTLDKNTAQTRKAAQKKLSKKIAALERRTGDCIFEAVCDAYLADQKRTVKASTYRRNRIAAETLQKIIGGYNPVESLTAGYVRKCLLDTGKGPGTLNGYIKRFKGIIRWAYSNDYISSPACADKLARFADVPHKEKIRDKFMDSDELNLLLSEMHEEHWKLLTEFLALSGLRVGEALALVPKDITDTDIIINKNYDYINNKTTTPKTEYSNDYVHIQPQLKAVIKKINSFMRMRRIITGHTRAPLWMINEEGNTLSYYAFNKYLKENTLRVLGRELTTHALRHTHASLLAEQGIPLEVIKRRLRHSDSRITEQIYIHVTKERKRKDDELIDEVNIGIC